LQSLVVRWSACAEQYGKMDNYCSPSAAAVYSRTRPQKLTVYFRRTNERRILMLSLRIVLGWVDSPRAQHHELLQIRIGDVLFFESSSPSSSFCCVHIKVELNDVTVYTWCCFCCFCCLQADEGNRYCRHPCPIRSFVLLLSLQVSSKGRADGYLGGSSATCFTWWASAIIFAASCDL